MSITERATDTQGNNHRINSFLDSLESTMCNLEDIASQCPTMDALEILCEQERRRELCTFFEVLMSLRLPNGKTCLDRVDRRIFYMYAMGFPMRTIAAKVNTVVSNIHRKLTMIPEKILRCQGGHLVNWDEFLRPPQSDAVADVPEVMLRWCLDAAENSWLHSYWGKSNNRKVYKTAVHCQVPDYFQRCFGDNETKCTLCGIQCAKH